MENDIVHLPFSRRAGGVHQGRALPVDGGSLAVRVSLVFIRVQHLNFIEPVQEYATVSALLTFSHCRQGLRKFHMELAIAEWLTCVELSSFWRDFKISVFNFPLR